MATFFYFLISAKGGLGGKLLLLIAAAYSFVGTVVTVLYIGSKSSTILKIFTAIDNIDKKMKKMGIEINYKIIYFFQISMLTAVVFAWITNLFYCIFFAKEKWFILILQFGVFGPNLENLCICLMYFTYFNWALMSRFRHLKHFIKKIDNSLSQKKVKRVLLDVSDIFLRLQRASNYNADTFLISVPIMYSSSNFFILMGILKFESLQSLGSKKYTFALGVFYSALIFLTVVTVEILKHMVSQNNNKKYFLIFLQNKTTLRKINELVMFNFDVIELSRLV